MDQLTYLRRRRVNSLGSPISVIVPDTIFQWDANLVASYPGTGQPLYNVITTPYGGDSQAALNWQLGSTSGVSTDDPSYLPGKFVSDGGGALSLVSSTPFLNSLHRSDSGQVFWAAISFSFGSVPSSTAPVFGNSSGSGISGWRVEWSSAATMILRRADGTNNASGVNLATSLTALTPYLAVLVYVPTTGEWKFAINSRTFNASGTSAFPNTVSSTNRFYAFAAANSSNRMPADSEFYGASMGAGDLTDSQLSDIVDYYNALHGRTYA